MFSAFGVDHGEISKANLPRSANKRLLTSYRYEDKAGLPEKQGQDFLPWRKNELARHKARPKHLKDKSTIPTAQDVPLLHQGDSSFITVDRPYER